MSEPDAGPQYQGIVNKALADNGVQDPRSTTATTSLPSTIRRGARGGCRQRARIKTRTSDCGKEWKPFTGGIAMTQYEGLSLELLVHIAHGVGLQLIQGSAETRDQRAEVAEMVHQWQAKFGEMVRKLGTALSPEGQAAGQEEQKG
jgi:hypothetical protein